MKVNLEFDGLEEQHEMLTAIHARSLLIAMQDADNLLRAYQKYSNGTLEEAEKAIENARERLWDTMRLIDE